MHRLYLIELFLSKKNLINKLYELHKVFICSRFINEHFDTSIQYNIKCISLISLFEDVLSFLEGFNI